jgi:hypothetical protein
MVQLIDFDRIDIIKVKEDELKLINITIEQEGLLDLPASQLYDTLSTAVREKMAAAAILPVDNIWFEINIKDNTIDDDDSLYYLCANIIAANMLVGKDREREPRLKVPPIINTNGLFGFIWLKKMVNEQLVCDRVGGVVKINDCEVDIV